MRILGLGRIGTRGIHLGEHAVQGGNLGISLRQFQSFQWFQLFQTVGNIANDFGVGARRSYPNDATVRNSYPGTSTFPEFRKRGNARTHRNQNVAARFGFCDLRENNRNLPVVFASWPDGNLHVMAERNQEVH
jgi:hypothetical protein